MGRKAVSMLLTPLTFLRLCQPLCVPRVSLQQIGGSEAGNAAVLSVTRCVLQNCCSCCFQRRQLMANEPLEKLGFKDLLDEKSEAEAGKE